ncbi:hypothetical protein ACOSP7_009255 [Xanthoceras sorbifolium]
MSTQNHNSQHQDTNHIQININTTSSDPHNPFLDQEHDDLYENNGEMFGVILSRRIHGLKSAEKQDLCHDDGLVTRRTVSMRMEKQKYSSALDKTPVIRRAFSMRKTDSDSDSDSPLLTTDHCRTIDNEYDPVDEDEENLLMTPPIEYYNKRNNFFQVCRRLFRF